MFMRHSLDYSIGTVHDIEDDIEWSDFVPQFQRVNISGEDNTGVGFFFGYPFSFNQ